MKTIGLFEAKTKLSEICNQVAQSGQSITVTRRGTPLVRIDPIIEKTQTIRERRAQYITKYGAQESAEPEDFTLPERSDEIRTFDLGE